MKIILSITSGTSYLEETPALGKELAESHFFEMLRHHHGIANIDVAMAKQCLQKDKGLATSGKRATMYLRLEAICQYILQIQHDILRASSAILIDN